jgi:integrase
MSKKPKPKMPSVADEESGGKRPIFTDSWLKRVKCPAAGQASWTFMETVQRGTGLLLVVSRGGTKTWRGMRYVGGKPDTERLGEYKPDTDKHMPLKTAREQAVAFASDATKFRSAAAPDSFREVAEHWCKMKVDGKLLTAKDYRQRLNAYIFPRFKDVHFRDVDREKINLLLDHVEARHGARTADTCLTVLRSLMRWYESRHADYIFPIAKGMKRQGTVRRERILTDDEIRALWAAEGEFADLCRFALLTGSRLGKIKELRRPDISADGVWSVRTAPREKGTFGRVKLPQQALAIIERQPRLAGEQRIFPARDLGRPKDRLDAELKFSERWTIHDLRRTCRSLLARKRVGVPVHVAERVLGHSLKGVQAVYNQHDYFEELTEALERLAAEIERIVNPTPANNVVQLAR